MERRHAALGMQLNHAGDNYTRVYTHRAALHLAARVRVKIEGAAPADLGRSRPSILIVSGSRVVETQRARRKWSRGCFASASTTSSMGSRQIAKLNSSSGWVGGGRTGGRSDALMLRIEGRVLRPCSASRRTFYHLISAGRYIYVEWAGNTVPPRVFKASERAAWEIVSGGGGAPKPQRAAGMGWNFWFALCVRAESIK